MRRLLLLVFAVAAVGGGYLGAAALDGAEGGLAEGVRNRVTGAADAVRRQRAELRRARCDADVDGCREVSGRVVLVESVDPDGDGDLHVVVAGGGITGPGVTAIDVKPSLRPRTDPSLGDRVSAAGLVQRGSHGQDQLHALEFHVAGRD